MRERGRVEWGREGEYSEGERESPLDVAFRVQGLGFGVKGLCVCVCVDSHRYFCMHSGLLNFCSQALGQQARIFYLLFCFFT